MPNGSSTDLRDYFPSGSKATAIREEIQSEIDHGRLGYDDRLATKEQVQEMRNENRFWYVISLAITITVAVILYLLDKFYV